MTTLKVLHICETAIGGIASYLNLLDGFSGRINNVYVVPEGHADSLKVSGKIRTYPASGRNLKAVLAHIGEAKRALCEEAPDVLFCHSSLSLLALLAIRTLGHRVPVIYCAHGWAVSIFEDAPIKRYIIRGIEGRLSGLSDRVINISHNDFKIARTNGYRGTHVLIENAVKPPEQPPRMGLFVDGAPGDINLLFVGRHDRQKGLDILLDAFAQARVSRPELKLHIVGDKVRADGAASRAADGVSYAGWVPAAEIDSFYASADALLVPSRWEGFGLVVPEAMRNGTPVLCSDRGALPHLIEPARTGKVFSLEGESLKDLLASLDLQELRAMRPACLRAFKERFSATMFEDRLRKIYAELAGQDDVR